MQRLSIRSKLSLWYGGVLAVVLVLFGTTVYLTMRFQLLKRIDQGLTEELSDVLHEVRRASDAKGLQEWLERRFALHEGFDFQITRPDGETFFVSRRMANASFPAADPHSTTDTPAFDTNTAEGLDRWRVIHTKVQGPDGLLVVQVARSLQSYDHEMAELLLTFLVSVPLVLLGVVAGGYFLARRALAPVQRITQAANEITVDRLNQRIEVANPDDELGALAQTLNRMIGRLERAFTEMQRFTADAAHELRTPLAVIRSEAEVALRATRSPEEYSHVLENLLEETNRMSRLADQLLFLCRQDAGLHSPPAEPVALDSLLREVVGNMQLVGQDKGVQVSLGDLAPVELLGDSRLLRQVFYNLIDNAIKYGEPPGLVTLNSRHSSEGLKVLIADNGIGIPPEHLPHVFDRFYRVDQSRSDGMAAGLGLAICQSIVKSLGGSIGIESTVGRGTTVTVTLPNSRPR
jgi:heavy metal sensor kinase